MDHGKRRMTAYEETTGMIMPRVSSVISHTVSGLLKLRKFPLQTLLGFEDGASKVSILVSRDVIQ